MDELAEVREQIAHRNAEQRTAWLQKLRSRYSAWMFTSGAFALLGTLAAIMARSLFFGVAAAFPLLFAWNRRMELNRVEPWLSRRTPQNQQERIIWARVFYDEMSHSSVWLRITDWVSATVAVALIATVHVISLATSGFWTRLLYGLVYAFAALLVLFWLSAKRKSARELKARFALRGQRWSDLT